jgi:hypothetical protein
MKVGMTLLVDDSLQMRNNKKTNKIKEENLFRKK